MFMKEKTASLLLSKCGKLARTSNVPRNYFSKKLHSPQPLKERAFSLITASGASIPPSLSAVVVIRALERGYFPSDHHGDELKRLRDEYSDTIERELVPLGLVLKVDRKEMPYELSETVKKGQFECSDD
jgi:hypothetical protein